MTEKGFDVSSNNGKINWGMVGKTGYNFVFARASYGQRSKDARFKENVAGALAQGLHVGAYHYSYASDAASAEKEARHFLSVIESTRLDYPVVLDLEYNRITGKATKRWTEIATTFLSALEDEGYFAMLYSSRSMLRMYFDYARIARYAIWVADWSGRNGFNHPSGVWQYSNTGKIAGIPTEVDLDASDFDYAAIIRRAGLNRG
ncbi:MAG: glycoside hydrolase family 25 protein [Oscillospiraceae bacterium]|jgi:lysozyme|nr:glycoside hydrolase family 25 protein [Oscillospiraceae bacterium]